MNIQYSIEISYLLWHRYNTISTPLTSRRYRKYNFLLYFYCVHSAQRLQVERNDGYWRSVISTTVRVSESVCVWLCEQVRGDELSSMMANLHSVHAYIYPIRIRMLISIILLLLCFDLSNRTTLSYLIEAKSHDTYLHSTLSFVASLLPRVTSSFVAVSGTCPKIFLYLREKSGTR